jgi:hypothetical protein
VRARGGRAQPSLASRIASFTARIMHAKQVYAGAVPPPPPPSSSAIDESRGERVPAYCELCARACDCARGAGGGDGLDADVGAGMGMLGGEGAGGAGGAGEGGFGADVPFRQAPRMQLTYKYARRPLKNGALPPMPEERAKNPSESLKKLREDARVAKKKWELLAAELACKESDEEESEEEEREGNCVPAPFIVKVCD